jgi:osmoprotectant transport system substrate-binding protein
MRRTAMILVTAAVCVVLIPTFFQEARGQEKPVIIVGSKGFTEQTVVGNMVALLMENNGFKVDRKIGLGGTVICHEAVVRGDINVYVEYTGTGLTDCKKGVWGEV